MGRPGRRIAALAIDWAIAVAVSILFFNYNGWATTLAFAVLQGVFIPTLGGSIGHRLGGLRVVPLAGGGVGVWRPDVRTQLLVIVIPAHVWHSDQRGYHDKIAGTVLIRS